MSATLYSEKIRRYRGLKKHLNELSVLVGRPVEIHEISSTKKSINIRNSEKNLSICKTADAASECNTINGLMAVLHDTSPSTYPSS